MPEPQRHVAAELAGWVHEQWQTPLPPSVSQLAARHVFDSLACAYAAQQHVSVQAVRRAAASGYGPGEAVVFFGGRGSCLSAALINATMIRALDCNDAFVADGLGGHPSDIVAAIFACADLLGVSGAEFLRAIALGYELYWRINTAFGRFGTERTQRWDSVSYNAVVVAAVAAALSGAPPIQSAQAIAIAASGSYTLGQVRRGEVSMVKNVAAALTAQAGLGAALFAQTGLTGPVAAFEGSRGLFSALDLSDPDGFRELLLGPLDHWHIKDAAMKAYPAVITSQAPIACAIELTRHPHFDSTQIADVEVRLPDLPVIRQHIGEPARNRPETRESADHSIPFLVAVALQDGQVGTEQFERERWSRPDTRRQLHRVRQVIDPALPRYLTGGFPAEIVTTAVDGAVLTATVTHPPGTPANPLSSSQLVEKMTRLYGRDGDPTLARCLDRTERLATTTWDSYEHCWLDNETTNGAETPDEVPSRKRNHLHRGRGRSHDHPPVVDLYRARVPRGSRSSLETPTPRSPTWKASCSTMVRHTWNPDRNVHGHRARIARRRQVARHQHGQHLQQPLPEFRGGGPTAPAGVPQERARGARRNRA